ARKPSATGPYIIRPTLAPAVPVPSPTPPPIPSRNGITQLIDTNASTSTQADACLQVGETLNDTVNGITITTTGIGGTAPHEWITVQVTRATPTSTPTP